MGALITGVLVVTVAGIMFTDKGRTLAKGFLNLFFEDVAKTLKENGKYFMFLKSDRDPERNILLQADHAEGPYHRVEAFDRSMQAIEAGMYEGATACRVQDGRWCLFLDYYGVPGEGQGYVPFLADSLESGEFVRADRDFSFPYGYKHGTVIPITLEEYHRIRSFTWK